ncbi:MFS transporter [Arthrobacter sp. B2a2-09]|uniref:MFS transporter n=1 Tax=Arthrobacter sp. B2a2-09 TaxID=2952822 RepID=UPI0022CDA7A6|nr:MFS transporter [Arthrobacter sp. B2a2-09]MCZ9881632.1 MFS transporter [Arthrobacter sp. B2a2-09]
MAVQASPSPTARVPMRKIYLLALLELATLGALVTPLVVSLSLKVLQIVPASGKESALGLVTAIGAICAMLANPLFGVLSDRTAGRFGRRRPWIIGGTVAGLGAALVMAFATNLPILIIGWALSQIAYNATLAALSALLADQIPEAQRAKASGIFGAFGFLGLVPAMIVAALFATQLSVVILAMPVFAVAVVAVICIFLNDPPAERNTIPAPSLGGLLTSFFFNPLRVRMFTLVWIQRFAMQFGYTVISTFGLFYLMLRLNMEQSTAAALTSVATLASAALNVLAAFVCGYLASRRGHYGPFIAGSAVLMAASLLLKAFTGDLVVFWVATVLAGLALGVYYAVDLALAMRTLPTGEEGKFLGIFNMAKTLPQSIAPALAPFVVLIGGSDPVAGGDKNYVALYLVAAGAVLLSLVMLPALRPVLGRRNKTESVAAMAEVAA